MMQTSRKDSRDRKRALLDELARIQYQKDLIEKELANLSSHYKPSIPYNAGKAHDAGHYSSPHVETASKRNLDASSLPEPKKLKQDDASGTQQLFRQCSEIVTKLLKDDKIREWFHAAVPPSVPLYHSIVKNPMDLGTIRKNLNAKTYQSPLLFRDHVLLIVSNCRLFNALGTVPHIAGERLADKFERLWKESRTEDSWRRAVPEVRGQMVRRRGA
jgi:hypothetical protein